MKKLIYWIFLIPFMMISQNDAQDGYSVHENSLLSPQPDKVKQFEQGLAAHNKQFHTDGPYAARVYAISNGPNVGKYIWSMGPVTWSALDARPDDAAHNDDWTNNVVKYMTDESDQTYWKFNPELSNFPEDFEVNKLLVDIYDVKRFEEERMMQNMEKIAKVMKEKYPDLTYGVYSNELPSTKDGRDIAMVFFFDKMAWMGEDPKFVQGYEEVYGKDSWKSFLKEWGEITEGQQSELWIYSPELSGGGAKIIASDRQ